MRRLASITVFVSGVSFMAGLFAAPDQESGAVKPAADFSVKTLQGAPFALKQYRGKVVLLDFWATWCSPCRAFVPALANIYRRVGHEPFVMLSIAVDEPSEPAWRKFLADQRMAWPQYFDTQEHLARLFGVREIPTLIVIDGSGAIVERTTGEETDRATWLNDRLDHWIARVQQPD